MSSTGTAKHRGRTGPAKAQAQKLLRTMCNFILPLIQRAGGQKTMKRKRMNFGIEAEEFVIELERFVFGMISHSLPGSQDIAIETTCTLLKDPVDYLEGTSWLWDICVSEDDEIIDGSSDDNRTLEHHYPMVLDRSVRYASPPRMPQSFKEVEEGLQALRRHITQKMPIRLLCFEPDNSNLRISLLEKADIYNYLARKFRNESDGLVINDWIEDHARYAILSHTWTQNPGELTYGDWQSGFFLSDRQSKCQKVVNFCKAAWEDHRITLGWIDTVCINKESSAELDESIRSMFAWYCNAAVCITYLAGTCRLSDMRNDRWFSRGWTLQELIAPRRIKFYNMDWKQLSIQQYTDGDVEHYQGNDIDNDLILEEIRYATTITRYELNSIQDVSISRKMQLAANRQVTREEDTAYCLMGIFNISISTAYGEGADRAFFRLVEEIFRSTKDVSDIFNWAGRHHFGFKSITTLFPSSPSSYLNRLTKESGPGSWCSWRPIEPLTLTHLGLRTPLLLMSSVPSRNLVSDQESRPYRHTGDYYATISVSPSLSFPRSYPKLYYLLNKGHSESEGLWQFPWGEKITLTFGTLNVEKQGTSIRIPKNCLAVLLERPWHEGMEISLEGYEKVCTEKPIVFDLKKTGENFDDDGNESYYQIETSELAKHRMELVTLVL